MFSRRDQKGTLKINGLSKAKVKKLNKERQHPKALSCHF